MFSIEVISLALIIAINTMVLWMIAAQSRQVVINRYFALAVAFVIFWATGTSFLLAGGTQELVGSGRLLFLVAPMYSILFLSLFAAVFPRVKGRSLTPINVFLVLLTIGLSLFIAFDPSRFITTITLHEAHNSFTVDMFWYSAYTAYFNIAFFITFSEFILHLRHTKGHQHQQLIYVFAGTLMSAMFSLVTNLTLPILGIDNLIWLGPVWSLFYVVTISISIVRHQLFDIKLAAVRSVAYIGVLLTLSFVYYAIAYITSVAIIGVQTTTDISLSPINIFLALVLAFLFQPVKRFFDRLTDNIFYRDNYRSEDFFASLSLLLTTTTDLRGLLERASQQLVSTFKAEQALFFLHYTNGSEHHMSAGTRKHARLPLEDARLLYEFVSENTENIFLSGTLDEGSRVRRMLASHRISLVMPLRQGEKVIGYVLLGDRLSSNYTKRDLDVLLTISNELVIAIQNALSLHEVKELNATLQQRINVATKELRSSNAQLKHLDEVKDEFMSMASHQLRTPLTSVKGYISMVIEGDAGKISQQQQKLLMEAFKSSERMVGLINDFLNVSRLQTGRFVMDKTEFDLGAVVKQEVFDLNLIARTHGVKLRLNATKQPLPLVADESKLRQVIMNYIDNAIYYSHTDSTVVINLEKVGENAAFTVVDTGIGVPKEEQARLFNKFFRAKNARKARPDGTGVGLYLARRVLTAHGGEIIFSSLEGKGSTFGFRMPLSKAPAKNAIQESV